MKRRSKPRRSTFSFLAPKRNEKRLHKCEQHFVCAFTRVAENSLLPSRGPGEAAVRTTSIHISSCCSVAPSMCLGVLCSNTACALGFASSSVNPVATIKRKTRYGGRRWDTHAFSRQTHKGDCCWQMVLPITCNNATSQLSSRVASSPLFCARKAAFASQRQCFALVESIEGAAARLRWHHVATERRVFAESGVVQVLCMQRATPAG